MFLTYEGLGCFKIQSKDALLITDPYQDSVGWKLAKVKTDIVTISDPENPCTNNSQRIIGEPLLIDKPGEYESKKTFIYGIPRTEQEQYPCMFLMEVEDVFIAHLGLLSSTLTEKHLEILEGADVLLLPIHTLKDKASEVISQIEPRIVIPMYYQLPGLKNPVTPLNAFAKDMGFKGKEDGTETKLKISKKSLPTEETSVVILKKS